MKKRTFNQVLGKRYIFNMLDLPGTKTYKLEILNKYGSNIERVFYNKTGKNVFGISHLIEHLGFRSPKDYTTEELVKSMKNEGSHNAYTDYDKIGYWFRSTMDRIDEVNKIITNVAFNTLDKIPSEEFELEKKVVYNEAMRYLDDDQSMFWLNNRRCIMGYHQDDNIVGSPEGIENLTQDDCIMIKDIFLQYNASIFNVTFDSNIMSSEEIISKIEKEVLRHTPLKISEPISHDEYLEASYIKSDRFTAISDNKSDQSMTYLLFKFNSNEITADVGDHYLSTYAHDTSMNDVIREQNGLTYGIHFGTHSIGYDTRTFFGCDVSKGDETKLMDLFKKSIFMSKMNWSRSIHKELLRLRKLQREMDSLNQSTYEEWHYIANWNYDALQALRNVLSEDVDVAYDVAEEIFCSYEQIDQYINSVHKHVRNENFARVINYDTASDTKIKIPSLFSMIPSERTYPLEIDIMKMTEALHRSPLKEEDDGYPIYSGEFANQNEEPIGRIISYEGLDNGKIEYLVDLFNGIPHHLKEDTLHITLSLNTNVETGSMFLGYFYIDSLEHVRDYINSAPVSYINSVRNSNSTVIGGRKDEINYVINKLMKGDV